MKTQNNPATAKELSSGRFGTLDGMRGIAAILVMAMHFFKDRPETVYGRFHFLNNADLAVDFFFMLSGFVVAQAYGDRLAGGLSALRFIRLRLVRLYPMFFIGMLLGLGAYGLMLNGGQAVPSGMELHLAALLNFAFLPVLNHGTTLNFDRALPTPGEIFPFLPPAWSLFFELVANVSFAFLFRLPPRALCAVTGASFVAMVLFGLYLGHGQSLSFSPGWGTENAAGGLFRVTFGFYAGVLLHRLGAHRGRFGPLPAPLRKSGVLYALLAASLAMPIVGKGIFPAFFLLVLSPLLIVAGAQNQVRSRTMARLSHALGWLSYPVYCLHFAIGRLVWVWGDRHHFTQPINGILATAASLVLATMLAAWVEPFGRRLLGRILPGGGTGTRASAGHNAIHPERARG